MEYVYGALLLHKTGVDINDASLTKVVAATGKDVDEAKVKVLVASLKGLDIAKELESASLATAAPAASVKEEAKEEKKEEKAAEAADGLASLFG